MSKALSILMIVCIVLAPGAVQSGTVILKNGHVINGKIIVSDDEKVIMTWGNGRTTIYHRFIESISLTEEEELGLRQYRSAKSISVSKDVNQSINLPDFNELHGLEEQVENDVEIVELSNPNDTGSVTNNDAEGLTEQTPLITLEDRGFQRFGISLGLPASWLVKEYKDSLSIRSDCGGVLIAVDFYQGGALTSGRAAVGLQGMLNDQGFQQIQNGLGGYMNQLDSDFMVESLSPGQNHHSVHALLGSESTGSQQLFSMYTSLDCEQESLGLLESVMNSLEFTGVSP